MQLTGMMIYHCRLLPRLLSTPLPSPSGLFGGGRRWVVNRVSSVRESVRTRPGIAFGTRESADTLIRLPVPLGPGTCRFRPGTVRRGRGRGGGSSWRPHEAVPVVRRRENQMPCSLFPLGVGTRRFWGPEGSNGEGRWQYVSTNCC